MKMHYRDTAERESWLSLLIGRKYSTQKESIHDFTLTLWSLWRNRSTSPLKKPDTFMITQLLPWQRKAHRDKYLKYRVQISRNHHKHPKMSKKQNFTCQFLWFVTGERSPEWFHGSDTVCTMYPSLLDPFLEPKHTHRDTQSPNNGSTQNPSPPLNW